MNITDLSMYDTVILYGMGFYGKFMLNRIRSSVPNIVCWDRKQTEYDDYIITTPPVDFSCLADYGKYIIIITPIIPEYIAEMVDDIPDGCNVTTLYSFEEYKDGFHTSSDRIVFTKGYCPICERDVIFENRIDTAFLKGLSICEIPNVICANCGSCTRERATVDACNTFFPDWRNKTVHESSPSSSRITSMQSLGKYSYSYFYEHVPLGEYYNAVRCENLERLTFTNESIDYFITTDVFEHIHSPLLAFAEIGRVLKKGGAHIFTVPYNNTVKTSFRVKRKNGELQYLNKPVYHVNPISEEGSLVTVDWGYDIGKYIWEASGMELLEYTCYKPTGSELFKENNKVFISMKTK